MESTVFERVLTGLAQKRQNLQEWFRDTPRDKRALQLGPLDEAAVHAQVELIDEALEEAESQTLGLCEVCHDHIESELLEMDYTYCVCLSHFSPEERSQLEADLELSQTVQRALLPRQLPQIPGLEVAAFSRPARIVGGDYFDFLKFHDGSYGITIGDVAGKGVSASLLMASLQAFLRTLAPESTRPDEVFTRLNRLFTHNIHYTTFVTLFLARWDDVTHALDYCNAGHNPALLYRTGGNGSGTVRWLRASAAAIGLVEGGRFTCESETLSPGDVLLLYTDGVVEATNSQFEEFGYERLAGAVRDGAGLPAGELVNEVRSRLLVFVDGQPLADDTTIIVCRVTE